jgi:hypothetical protein
MSPESVFAALRPAKGAPRDATSLLEVVSIDSEMWGRGYGSIRFEGGGAKISSVERHTTGDIIVRRVDVQNAVIAVSNPDDFRYRAAEGRLGGVSGRGVEEVPGRSRLCCCPVVFGFREQRAILRGQHTAAISIQVNVPPWH